MKHASKEHIGKLQVGFILDRITVAIRPLHSLTYRQNEWNPRYRPNARPPMIMPSFLTEFSSQLFGIAELGAANVSEPHGEIDSV